jgi:preprotein translocase subunit SecA
MPGLAILGRKLFGRLSGNSVKSIRPIVAKINDLEPEFRSLSDEGLRERTATLRARAQGGQQLEALLPEAFANCREALRRTLGLRAFDVQLMGGIFLHRGNIAEMATGEGKTLVAVFPAYLNALAGKGVHIGTVNDYLAKRDAEWMGKAYAALGVTSGLVYPGQLPPKKRSAYQFDVTYSTSSELAFDYLRDNMKSSLKDMVQRGHFYAIIDEADSVLIDEARTPLIISGPSHDDSDLYVKINEIMSRIQPEHFDLDEKLRTVTLTDEGNDFVEKELVSAGLLPEDQSLYESESNALILHVMQALRAHKIYHRDQQYVIRENDVVLVNVSTGRMMPQRRLSEGLHQAIEAKEGVPIQAENVTLASTSVQNYFRLYQKLAGMTGTAVSDSEEFMDIYSLGVIPLPTNEPIRRRDEDDQIYHTASEKYFAVVEAIRDANKRGQPVLVGTTSIEKSDQLSSMLRDEGIRHNVLNAHHHEIESQIIADAGKFGAVTIATNMAGRGTDIQLGGSLEMKLKQAIAAQPNLPIAEIRAQIEIEHDQEKSRVLDAGGLFVLGTERHESRRIDSQLRGRSGRQGDPGRTSFFLSLEDELMRNIEAQSFDRILAKLKLEENQVITHPWLKKLLDKAQSRVESRNLQFRKQLLKFDNVINEQRKAIFSQRLEIMQSPDLSEIVNGMRDKYIDDLIAAHMPDKSYAEQWDAKGLDLACRDSLMLDLPIAAWVKEEATDIENIRSRIILAANSKMAEKAEMLGSEMMRNIEKQVLLQAIDAKWREHIVRLDQLRSVIGLRSYGRRDPFLEFRAEAFGLFEHMLTALRQDICYNLARIRPLSTDEQMAMMGKFLAQNHNASSVSDKDRRGKFM